MVLKQGHGTRSVPSSWVCSAELTMDERATSALTFRQEWQVARSRKLFTRNLPQREKVGVSNAWNLAYFGPQLGRKPWRIPHQKGYLLILVQLRSIPIPWFNPMRPVDFSMNNNSPTLCAICSAPKVLCVQALEQTIRRELIFA